MGWKGLALEASSFFFFEKHAREPNHKVILMRLKDGKRLLPFLDIFCQTLQSKNACYDLYWDIYSLFTNFQVIKEHGSDQRRRQLSPLL